ncbi:MAG: hypothetical protein IKX48_17910, partial [Victivallales bacterium]|nr:hypothetical protein [Victivallales bacterium]
MSLCSHLDPYGGLSEGHAVAVFKLCILMLRCALRLESKPYRATNLLPAGPDNAGMPQARISATVFEEIDGENMSDGECRKTGV